MANIAETPVFTANVYEIATTDPVEGGTGGIANAQAQALANRTLWLKQQAEAVWRTGDVKEVDCNAAYIAANFDNTGLGTNERLGWAICNGANGTKDRGGRVSMGYGNGYTTPGAVGGSKDAVVVSHNHSFSSSAGNDGGTGLQVITTGQSNEAGGTFGLTSTGVSGTDKNLQPYIVTLFIQKL